MLRKTTLTISNTQTGDKYYAKSYPDADYDNNGRMEAYETPVYWFYIEGKDHAGRSKKIKWKALRFMPYWNDPARPSTHYRTKGWVNAGLHQLSKRAVTLYKPHYSVQNTPSPYDGAIQLRNSFLIHAGPPTLGQPDWGWGSAGCVEIVGNFNKFKADIQQLSGSRKPNVDAAIQELVKARKLWVQVQLARPPKLRQKRVGEFR